jgi:hypothetical protein
MTITDERAIELGRAVAAWDARWWSAGMRTMPDRDGRVWRLSWKDDERTAYNLTQESGRRLRHSAPCVGGMIPDLRDRPTQAGVLEQIEKALSAPCHIQPTAYFVTDNGRKCWRVHCAGVFAHANSRAEAIAAAARFLIANPPWYLDERTRETGERWPEPCSTFVNVDPDEYPDQPGCDRCGHPKGAH